MTSRKRSLLIFSVLLFASALLVSDIMAQGRGGQRGGGRGPGGQGRGGPQARQGGGDITSLLRREDVQKELDLTEDQIKDIEAMNEDRRRGGRDGGRDLRSELEGLSEEERREKFRELREEREKETEKTLGSILVGKQFTRLKQLYLQQSSNRRGNEIGLGRRLAEALEISEDQLEDIEKKAEELEEEFRKEVAELRAEVQAKLLKELTPKQQKLYKELIGEAFQFQSERRDRGERPDRGGPQGRQRGEGGRGLGDRGARRPGDDEKDF